VLQLLEAGFDDLIPERWGLSARLSAGFLLLLIYLGMVLLR